MWVYQLLMNDGSLSSSDYGGQRSQLFILTVLYTETLTDYFHCFLQNRGKEPRDVLEFKLFSQIFMDKLEIIFTPGVYGILYTSYKQSQLQWISTDLTFQAVNDQKTNCFIVI